MIDPDDNDFYEDEDGIGCSNCDGGWVHACCDDLCRGSADAADCLSARARQTCNPHGDR